MRGLVLVLVLLAPLSASQSAAERVDVDAWWTRTLLDADRNGVDDALVLAGTQPVTLLVDYAALPTGAQLAELDARGAQIVHVFRNFPIVVARVAADRAISLLDAPGVVLLESIDTIRPQLKESVPLIGAPQAWKTYGSTGKGVVVAVLDDGAYEQHPDFQGKIAAHYDAGNAGSPVQRPSQVDVLAPAGEDGHGTHVAGTVIGQGGESGGVYKGVAPDAKFVNVKVFSGPNQTTSDLVLKGLDWTLDNAERLKIRVAVMSLGGRPSDGTDALSRGVNVAVDKGLVIVAASGNAGPAAKSVTSPGAAERAITVGAVDKQKRVASFSSRGPTLDGRVKPDLAAPGVNIVSTVPPVSTGGVNNILQGGRTSYYGPLSGTSMAAPHVAGVVALMLQANPTLSPQDIKRMLLVTAQEIGKPGIDNETGYGFVNGAAAVQVAKDPKILDQPQYRARLATIPDPEPESFLERLAFDARNLSISELGLVAVVGIVGSVVVLAIVLARRR